MKKGILFLILCTLISTAYTQVTGSWQGVLIQNNADGTTSNFSVWMKFKQDGKQLSGSFRSEQVPPPYYKISELLGHVKGDTVIFEDEKISKHKTQENFKWCFIKAKLYYNKKEKKLSGKYISKNNWCKSGKLVMVAANREFNDNTTEITKHSSFEEVTELIVNKESVVGLQFILKDVHFLSGKYNLTSSSYNYLNQIVAILKEHPTITIHLKGFTDSDGDDEDNFILSQKRAKSVSNYFIKKGVASKRITYEGYGEARPIFNNDSSENKQLNRRVELLIVSQ